MNLKQLTKINYLFISFSDFKKLYFKYFNDSKIIKKDQCVIYLVKGAIIAKEYGNYILISNEKQM